MYLMTPAVLLHHRDICALHSIHDITRVFPKLVKIFNGNGNRGIADSIFEIEREHIKRARDLDESAASSTVLEKMG